MFRKLYVPDDQYMGSSVANGTWPESIPLDLSQVVEYSMDHSLGMCVPATHTMGKFNFTDRSSGRRCKVHLCWEREVGMRESLLIYYLSFYFS